MSLLLLVKSAATGSGPGDVTFTAGTVRLSTASETSCTPALPAGLTTDDWMVAVVALVMPTTGTITTPAGWTAIIDSQAPTGTTVFRATVATRKWVSGDSAPVFATTSGRTAAVVIKVTGADPTTAFETPAWGSTATTTTTPIAPTVTSTTGIEVLRVWTGRGNTLGAAVTFTPPGGDLTQIAQGSTAISSVNESCLLVGADTVTAGAVAGTETATATSSANVSWVGAIVTYRGQ